MTTLTRHYRPVALVVGGLLVIAVVALRSNVLLGAVWANSGFMQFNHLLSQDISPASPTGTLLRSTTTATLQKATGYNPQNSSAWRALGTIAFLVGDEATAVRAWKNAPAMVGELWNKGREAQLANQHDAALAWFHLVIQLAPTLANGWFFQGLSQEAQGRWSLAADSYETALRQPAREWVEQSDPYFRLGRAFWQLDGIAYQDDILANLDQALAADDFSGEWARAQTHYLRGLVLKQAGQGREAAAEFAWVADHDPNDYWANVQVGLLAWELDHDLTAAEQWLQKAIKLAENNKWAYRHLGQMYEASEQADKAAAMYRRVLLLDPDDGMAAAFLAMNNEQ